MPKRSSIALFIAATSALAITSAEDISLKAGENDKLFGSVTKSDIEKLLLENNIKIDKKYIDLKSSIKTLGSHKINIKFTSELSGSFQLNIEKED